MAQRGVQPVGAADDNSGEPASLHPPLREDAMPVRVRSLLTLALLLTLVVPARAAALRGRVTVPPAPAADATFRPYAGRASSLPCPEHPPRGLVTDTVIFVDSSAAE